jgi:hypothetical protein
MAITKIVVNRGLQVLIGRAFDTADSFAKIQSVSIDDGTTAFGATDTALDDGGAISNAAYADFTSTPTRSGQVVSWSALFIQSVSLTVKRIALNNIAAASMSTSADGLIAGTAGRNLVKDNDFELQINGTWTETNNS